MKTLNAVTLVVDFFAMWGERYAGVVYIQVVVVVALDADSVFVHFVTVGGDAGAVVDGVV